MSIFFTSDEHYFHTNIIYHCNRPFKDISEMNSEIIRRHNDKVQPTDMVFHIGDFAWKSASIPDLLSKLNGEKHLIMGNHDACFPSHKKNQKSVRKYLEYGFASVNQTLELKLADKTVLLSHLPYRNEEDPDQRYQQFRPTDEGLFLLHGHVHSSYLFRGHMINVGVDVWNYTPVSQEAIEDLIRTIDASL